jgi:hypothetical protein
MKPLACCLYYTRISGLSQFLPETSQPPADSTHSCCCYWFSCSQALMLSPVSLVMPRALPAPSDPASNSKSAVVGEKAGRQTECVSRICEEASHPAGPPFWF